MYHPYLRGKQFELIAVRETADMLAKSGFVPIIEPVRENLNGLKRTLLAVHDAGGQAVLIVNPYHGDHKNGGNGISTFLDKEFQGKDSIKAGLLLKEDTSTADALALYKQHKNHTPYFIHAGFSNAKALVEELGDELANTQHVFTRDSYGSLYKKHFKEAHRVLIRDGFERRKNADYPEVERFSDLHVTFKEEGMDGFGDFLIVGDDYSESGGPAYAVAIHLTFIDDDKDDEMFIYHFVSKDRDTPTDPAGKFAQALEFLIEKLESGNSKILETSAIAEFRSLHEHGHFPGLGYVKKLSMKHHIETLSDYFSHE